MTETSWISEQKRLLELQNDCEPEPMESITCQFIFVDSNKFIQKIAKEKAKIEYDVENDQYIVSKKHLLQMIQRQKTAMNNSKYLYKHLCIFNIDLESEDVHPFTQESSNDNDEFFETISSWLSIKALCINFAHLVNFKLFFMRILFKILSASAPS